jgi:hypothetical protein
MTHLSESEYRETVAGTKLKRTFATSVCMVVVAAEAAVAHTRAAEVAAAERRAPASNTMHPVCLNIDLFRS